MDKDRIAGSAKDWAGKSESAIGNAMGDADTEAAGRVREAAGKVQNLYGQAKDAARDAAGTVVDYARGDGAEAIARLVRQNPVGSLLAAGAIGFALALMMARPAPQTRRRWRYDY
jgi:uncharacterized protein YjbJ (UPF0337 family)